MPLPPYVTPPAAMDWPEVVHHGIDVLGYIVLIIVVGWIVSSVFKALPK